MGDYATALENWQPLAAQGDATAQFTLGFMYDRGQGVPQDYAEAGRWFRFAAAQGDALAQGNLGVLYENGQGLPQDHVLCHMWFNLPGATGAEPALESRRSVEALMTSEQIADAQARARVCLSSGYQTCN